MLLVGKHSLEGIFRLLRYSLLQLLMNHRLFLVQNILSPLKLKKFHENFCGNQELEDNQKETKQ